MLNFFKRIFQAVKSFISKITPGEVAWKGANKAIATTAVVIWILGALFMFVLEAGTPIGLTLIVIGLILAFLCSASLILLLLILKKLPKSFLWVLPGAFFLTTIIFGDSLAIKFPLLVIGFSGLAGAGLFSLTKKNRGGLSIYQVVVSSLGSLIGLAGLVWGLIWLFDTGSKPEIEHIDAAQTSPYKAQLIEATNPAEEGAYKVGYLTYGSGNDKQRKEFAEGVTIVTDSVDGSRLLDNWEGFAGKLRTHFWGFDEEALPINGRVWYPEGDGPFPLALIVHGNHGMEDFSDPGYEYLGKLLASQGMIMVSVDENFINSSWKDIFGDGLDEENDARGWLLLEHLKYWRKWNDETDNVFQNKVDLENIAVMGHSRGGEAAAVAGFFNKLQFYPDDAKQKFDFDFNIKSVVAIAPVDGQYKPGEIQTPLENVNYLVLHGANDGDVQSFAGLRQYERVKFTDSIYHFKSAVYIYGANHGQFNTTWGNSDSGQPYGSLLNKKALLPMEDQLEIGRVYISAFLQATLQGKKEYEALFKDHRSGNNWLPTTIYLNQYESSGWKIIADFEEDLDLTTNSSGGKVTSENLTVWREQMVGMKWGNKATQAVYVGWDSLAYEGKTAWVEFSVDDNFTLAEAAALTFELAESKERSYPDKDRDKKKKDEELNENNELNNGNNNSNENNQDTEESEDKEEDDKKAPDPIDFSILLTDTSDNTVQLTLSEYSYLQRQLTVDVLKTPSLQSAKTSEAVYNTFFIYNDMLISKSSEFNLNELFKVRFVFDKSPKGVIIIDKIALN
ncbi:alpha/beta hydrolase family protein [Roseivirga echinicomitans]|uniref:Uncharacterized protein n=1 Tax=Roseivirga echinicomitans TaxID=296218 RepID=A0A150XJW2_9BACT|nr:hypothetical protein [Roseivirga echinicomitans]KYG78993.1 hypothetical protein AWN68_05010 [Roseivirga echinicomitans]